MKGHRPKKQNIAIAKSIEEGNAVTHSGPFHGDDVVACAILSYVMPQVLLIRTRDPAIITAKKADKNTVFFDVGGQYEPDQNLFDHHQRSFYRLRDDGTPYAAAGLLWDYYGEDIVKSVFDCPEEYAKDVVDRVDRMLIRGIDLRDLGLEPNTYSLSVSGLIALSNPISKRGETADDRFVVAAEYVKKIVLSRAILHAIQAEEGRRQTLDVIDAIQDDSTEVLVLPNNIHGWNSTVISLDRNEAKRLKFVVYESDEYEDDYVVEAISESSALNRYEDLPFRMEFPMKWRGEKGYRLRKITGIETALYCHEDGHLAAARTKEDAIKLAELAISIAKKQMRKALGAIEDDSAEVFVMSENIPGWKNLIVELDDDIAARLKFGVHEYRNIKYGDGYVAEAIPRSYHANQCSDGELFRALCPDKWKGQKDENLRRLTKVKTARACSKSGARVYADTAEGAIELAQLAIRSRAS